MQTHETVLKFFTLFVNQRQTQHRHTLMCAWSHRHRHNTQCSMLFYLTRMNSFLSHSLLPIKFYILRFFFLAKCTTSRYWTGHVALDEMALLLLKVTSCECQCVAPDIHIWGFSAKPFPSFYFTLNLFIYCNCCCYVIWFLFKYGAAAAAVVSVALRLDNNNKERKNWLSTPWNNIEQNVSCYRCWTSIKRQEPCNKCNMRWHQMRFRIFFSRTIFLQH